MNTYICRFKISGIASFSIDALNEEEARKKAEQLDQIAGTEDEVEWDYEKLIGVEQCDG